MEQVLYTTIARNIRKLRKKNYMSQAQLAERAEVSVDTIKSVENALIKTTSKIEIFFISSPSKEGWWISFHSSYYEDVK